MLMAYILCVCAHMHKCIRLPMQMKLLVGYFFPLSVFVPVMHACTRHCIFYDTVSARVSLYSPSASIFDVASLSLKR